MKNRITKYFNILFCTKSQNENLQDLKIIIFRDKTTSQSINLFLQLKKEFEDELIKRKTKAIQENTNVVSYFNRKQNLPYTTVNDSVYKELIKQ
jgi:hypothetical protein